MQKCNKLAIFDLDGTLFNTKEVNYRAYLNAIRKCGYQVLLDYDFFCRFCNGNNYHIFLPELIPGITQGEMQTIHDEKKRVYTSFLKFAEKNECLFSLMECLRREYMIALVTTACRRNVEDLLDAFQVQEKFDIIITQEDVTACKPAPECFLVAMKRTGILAENTIIFEDSEPGLVAAKASGANYVKVYGYN